MNRGERATTRGRTGLHPALLAPTIALLTTLPGCSTEQGTYVGQRSNPIYATQSLGTLEALLPEQMAVRSVIAAAGATLRDRGYSIWSTRTTDERGRIEARPPGRRLGGTWVIQAWATENNQTALSVRSGAWDRDDGAKVLVDAILQRLGR